VGEFMNKRVYNRNNRAITNFIRRRLNLRRQLFNIIGVIIILLFLLILKLLNNSITNNIIQIVESSINYDFSLKKDGQAILDYSKKILELPEKALEVFNFTNPFKHPPPIEGTIYKPFGQVKYLNGKTEFNNGIDIIPKEDKDPVAIAEGVVKEIEDRDTKGYFITVEHNGYSTVYGYLTKVYVNEGDKVEQGTKLGTLGTNKDGNKYLRFEVWVNNSPVNPMEYIYLN